jgi:integrase
VQFIPLGGSILSAIQQSGSEFQIRDLRAKAATEVEQSERGLSGASDLLGHASQQMTKHYVRNKFGKLVKPTK